MKRSRRDDARHVGLPVGEEGSVSLVPVGPWILEDKELIADMAKWRFAARANYVAQFPYSPESMRRYLETVSIADPATLLFVIERDRSEVVGHVGLRRASDLAAEIDSVMRKPDGPPGWVRPSLAALMAWSLALLGPTELTLRVMSGNERAIGMYRNLGFRAFKEVPLRQRWEGETLFLEEVTAGQLADYPQTSLHMRLRSTGYLG